MVDHDFGLLPKVRPRGKALKRTEKDLEELTSPEALEELVEEAQEDWRDNTPKKFQTLLDSKKSDSK